MAQGTFVKKGTVLARLDPAEQQAVVNQARAEVQKAKANLQKLEKRRTRRGDRQGQGHGGRSQGGAAGRRKHLQAREGSDRPGNNQPGQARQCAGGPGCRRRIAGQCRGGVERADGGHAGGRPRHSQGRACGRRGERGNPGEDPRRSDHHGFARRHAGQSAVEPRRTGDDGKSDCRHAGRQGPPMRGSTYPSPIG
ncbi:biotin/lipoyl-binding protein [Roseibium salinum]|nr:biotin/lipoyl-binding protein [Roseibium salinum]